MLSLLQLPRGCPSGLGWVSMSWGRPVNVKVIRAIGSCCHLGQWANLLLLEHLDDQASFAKQISTFVYLRSPSREEGGWAELDINLKIISTLTRSLEQMQMPSHLRQSPTSTTVGPSLPDVLEHFLVSNTSIRPYVWTDVNHGTRKIEVKKMEWYHLESGLVTSFLALSNTGSFPSSRCCRASIGSNTTSR